VNGTYDTSTYTVRCETTGLSLTAAARLAETWTAEHGGRAQVLRPRRWPRRPSISIAIPIRRPR
jgi:hypothetical protein